MAKKKLPKELDSIVKEVQALSNELKEEESKIIPITEREGYWDFPLSVEIQYFDPLYSYEITGYKEYNKIIIHIITPFIYFRQIKTCYSLAPQIVQFI